MFIHCWVWFWNPITGQSWSRRKWIVNIWRDAVRLLQKRIGGYRRNYKNWEPWKLLSHSICSFQLPLSPCVPLVNGWLPTHVPRLPPPPPPLPPPTMVLKFRWGYLLVIPEYCPSLMVKPKHCRPKPIRWLRDLVR